MAKEAAGNYSVSTGVMIGAQVVRLTLGVFASIIIARYLGPKGQGVYGLVIVFITLTVSVISLGIGPATTYFVARKEYDQREILGSNVFLSAVVGGVGVGAGLVLVLFFHDRIFPDIPQGYLLLSLALIPVQIFNIYTMYILLGNQEIKKFNSIQVIQSLLMLIFVITVVVVFDAGVIGVIIATLTASSMAGLKSFLDAKAVAGGVKYTLNLKYIKNAIKYGIQAHLSNILGMLNYRIDTFLVNGYLGPVSVGYYTVAVGLVERLWMVSQAAGTVLFPRVAAEKDAKKLKEFTPKVARSVIWFTAAIALVTVFAGRWVILLLYSETYLPAAAALQALAIGIVTLSASRILANDIAGRGYPMINTYRGFITVSVNVALNIMWIPKYGIVGAAWASSVSYTASFLTALYFYCRLSGNRWQEVVFIQRGDWYTYKLVIIRIWIIMKSRLLGKFFGS